MSELSRISAYFLSRQGKAMPVILEYNRVTGIISLQVGHTTVQNSYAVVQEFLHSAAHEFEQVRVGDALESQPQQ